jgi:hypothetical protein
MGQLTISQSNFNSYQCIALSLTSNSIYNMSTSHILCMHKKTHIEIKHHPSPTQLISIVQIIAVKNTYKQGNYQCELQSKLRDLLCTEILEPPRYRSRSHSNKRLMSLGFIISHPPLLPYLCLYSLKWRSQLGRGEGVSTYSANTSPQLSISLFILQR